MHHINDSKKVKIALLTISDTRNFEDDRSGKTIKSLLEAANHTIIDYKIEKDELHLIQEIVTDWTNNAEIQAIILNGGTGFSPRDVTYEAITQLLDKKMDGFGELFRMLSYEEIGPKALFSRAVAGSIGSTGIYALPGSTNAVKLAIEKLILPTLPHFVEELVKK
ncbi:MogA/MoaB family molybdenum cofactor biosynthesis protein [Halalkalibacter akibai]|uniref:Molybdenum cofactor biosynthesis protein B n=1 Tax=Halalkalibacter akibai (strain ATCC 43226 / DSM 21942 / CIP 109018 / JCM 9157 / 1139) TaxID=1236973 RepID=W4QY18_HALA3|nr:MogA/MoaB family molybdenum cofactor biosynthesis protein [Halalkalibacter akibai]GAE36219.1 molybdenum cofactor biosynthesis protein MoaB [Halalkalibacter akibai JCM 9157]